MLFGTELEAVVPFLSDVRSHSRKGHLCKTAGRSLVTLHQLGTGQDKVLANSPQAS